MGIVAVILTVSTFAFAWLFIEIQNATRTFNTYSNFLIQKDYDSAYALTTGDFQAALTKSAFIDQQKALCLHLGALKRVIQGSSETDGNQYGWTSIVHARFVYEQAEREFVFVMKKQSNKWKVFSYKELG